MNSFVKRKLKISEIQECGRKLKIEDEFSIIEAKVELLQRKVE
jgi:hypothetical protein